MRVLGLGGSSTESGKGVESDGKAKLYLNVYDLTPINNYLYWFGLGIFHSGVEVHGMEYGFGAHEYPSSGIFEVEPRSCPGFIFRHSVLLGSTDMSCSEFQSFMECLSAKYHGDSYHLITKNCNHFSDEVSQQLTGKSIPGWLQTSVFKKVVDSSVELVGSVVVTGSFFKCLLPESLQITAVRHLPDHPAYSDEDDDDDGGSDSIFSSPTAGSEGEDSAHHLLTSPNADIALLKDKPVRLAKELL